MKSLFDVEDAIVGIIMGVLVLGLSGKIVSLDIGNWVVVAGFSVFSIFIVLDVLNEIFRLDSSIVMLTTLIIHNTVDLIVSAIFISKFGGITLPLITTTLVPLLDDPNWLLGIGVFLIVGNVFWMILEPFLD